MARPTQWSNSAHSTAARTSVDPLDQFLGDYATGKGIFTFNWDRMKGYEPIDLTSKRSRLDQIVTQAAGRDALNAALLVVPPDTPRAS